MCRKFRFRVLLLLVMSSLQLVDSSSTPVYASNCEEKCEAYATEIAEADAGRAYDSCMKQLGDPTVCEDVRQGVYDSSYGYWYRVCMEACEQGREPPEQPEQPEQPGLHFGPRQKPDCIAHNDSRSSGVSGGKCETLH